MKRLLKQVKKLNPEKKIQILSLIGLLDFTMISLYQLGFIKHLPDLPGKVFDSDSVNSSAKASILGVPDGPVSSLLYSLIILLVQKSAEKNYRIKNTVLGTLILVHALGATDYLLDMIKQKKICPYCLIGTLINFISVPLFFNIALKK